MSWEIEYSKDSDKFLEKNPQVKSALITEITKFIRKINGETINIDVKKMRGAWEGYYRIRKGGIRIIVAIETAEQVIYIDKIDFRGDVYK